MRACWSSPGVSITAAGAPEAASMSAITSSPIRPAPKVRVAVAPGASGSRRVVGVHQVDAPVGGGEALDPALRVLDAGLVRGEGVGSVEAGTDPHRGVG